MFITASKLYDYIQCPHRVWRDKYGPQDEKIQETNSFVELLWEKGVLHEKKIIKKFGKFVDISNGSIEERFNRTIEEMKKGVPLIYQGVLKYKKLLGIPDLLKKLPGGSYVPIDIKSGRGLEGTDDNDENDGKPKKHYAVQLCLYTEILQNLGYSRDNKGRIIDICAKEVEYILDARQGVKNAIIYWELYEKIKEDVSLLLANKKQNKPALSGKCKLCPWYISCKRWCKETNDLTNIFYLGRALRDVINTDLGIEKLEDLSGLNISDLMSMKKKNKNFLKGIGEANLNNFLRRAEIINCTKKPRIYKEIKFPKVTTELFFDIEDDPTQDFIYLHGVYERKNDKTRFVYFLAGKNTPDEEHKAWEKFWDYIKFLPKEDYAVYYYSHHEKTAYKRLREKYPDVISENELEEFFNNPKVIDLYLQVVLKFTDWPLCSYSIKDIATYLSFKWRDETPSGALSIKWYNDYLESKNPDILKRIIEYNEDDCKAMMVLKDYIEKQ